MLFLCCSDVDLMILSYSYVVPMLLLRRSRVGIVLVSCYDVPLAPQVLLCCYCGVSIMFLCCSYVVSLLFPWFCPMVVR